LLVSGSVESLLAQSDTLIVSEVVSGVAASIRRRHSSAIYRRTHHTVKLLNYVSIKHRLTICSIFNYDK